MEEAGKGILIARSICPYCLIPSHCSTNSYWIKPFILQLRHMAFSITYPCVMFICFRIKRDAQLIRLNLLLFQTHCFLSCQSQTVLNMGLITGIAGACHIRELGCRKVQNLSKCGSGLGGTNWLSSSLQLESTCTWDAGSPGQAQVPALGLGMGRGIAGPVANLWVILSGIQAPTTLCEVD